MQTPLRVHEIRPCPDREQMRTALPGKNSRPLLDRLRMYLPPGQGVPPPIWSGKWAAGRERLTLAPVSAVLQRGAD